MLFNSLDFVIFFSVVTCLYYLLPHKLRLYMLLLGSCYFYMFFVPKYIFILAFVIVVDFMAGKIIDTAVGRKKKAFLIISIFTNVGLLFIFKYFNFFNMNLANLANLLHWNYPIKNLQIILPIGLSFHTFQSLSYVIEVYRGKQKSEKNFLIYALYVMFYPQLVAGPIERPQNILHQLHEKHNFSFTALTDGLKIMLWGYFKKVVIADRLAIYVSKVYDSPHSYNSVTLIVATVFFAFQIYCDFSGYSDIAIGSAKIMGIKLMENFKQPYFSKSISEFWRRWHISLSTWFKDYLYIPLGGSRVSKWRRNLNLLITFTISGLWHGASWTYIVWGSFNGVLLVLENLTKDYEAKLKQLFEKYELASVYVFIRVIFTFTLVCLGHIFFRAKSLAEAIGIIANIVQLKGLNDMASIYQVTSKSEFALSIALIGFLTVVDYLSSVKNEKIYLSNKLIAFRWTFYYAVIFLILIFGVYGAENEAEFIYFQF